MKLAELTPDYDSAAFIADHKDDLVEEVRTLPPETEDDAAYVLYGYKYPGSGIAVCETDCSPDAEISFSRLFTDPAGRTWGWCSYHYGFRNFWVCLDEPDNGELPADENYVDILTRLTPAAEPAVVEAAAREARTPSAWLIAGAGGVVVVVAAIGAAAIKRRRKDAAAPKN